MNYIEDDAERVNEEFLEAAHQNFQEAIDEDDMKTCRLIIQDLKEKGFSSEAHILERELNWISDKKVLV